jgi:hypothetical protein
MNGGRPVLKIKAKNIVPLHNKQIVITYNFSRTRMFVEPLLLIGSVFLLFVMASMVSRMDDKGQKAVSSSSSIKQA